MSPTEKKKLKIGSVSDDGLHIPPTKMTMHVSEIR